MRPKLTAWIPMRARDSMSSSPRFAGFVFWLVVLVVLAGCSSSDYRETPLGPPAPTSGPGISGRVKLVARLSDASGAVTGSRTVESADSVRVHLRHPDGTLDSTLTRDGYYEFRPSAPGFYRVLAWVVPGDTVSSGDLAYAGDTLRVNDLEIRTSGDLVTYPNPFPSHEGLAMEMTFDTEQTLEIVILDLEGNTVWSYSLLSPPNFQHIHGVGTNNANEPQPNGLYWVRARFNDRYHYNLVFKE
jgi:hypothetical protein